MITSVVTLTLAATYRANRLNSPLLQAAYGGDVTGIRSAILRGANPNCRGPIKGLIHINTSLDIVRGYFVCQLPKWQEPALLIALKSGGDVQTRNRDEIVRLFVGNGAWPNSRDINGDTALILVADDESSDATRFLLENHANPNLADKERKTALMRACYYGRIETVRLLLSAGADISLKNDSGATAESFVRQRILKDDIVTRPTYRRIQDLLHAGRKSGHR